MNNEWLICDTCHAEYKLTKIIASNPHSFCPYCGSEVDADVYEEENYEIEFKNFDDELEY
jgi:hypothetical protein